ncbi:uncharacterized protein LOC111681106 [Lucilia cuprina]|uniref:uncharacterized protein LOC111681106 n=1 Tax=Lucilia cuprina TaxID=7375 RepID=UPI001F069506|nr:uncharacterized protein LOC111681106 [Lucilia cuprina]
MLPVLCFNKIFSIIFIVIVCCCIQFSQQQFPPDFQFNQLRPFGNFPRQNNINSQGSGLNNQNWLGPGQQLVFATTTSAPGNSVVFVNNQPAVPTMVPFIAAATTPTPQFLDCFSRCPTTSEFNPICASNRQQYGNEQKFNCARQCGAVLKCTLHMTPKKKVRKTSNCQNETGKCSIYLKKKYYIKLLFCVIRKLVIKTTSKMLVNSLKKEVFIFCMLLGISCTSALARVDNNWSHRRPNITVTQNQRGQAGYRPANVGYQQPLVHNQSHVHSYNNNHQQQHQQQQWQQQHNNRSQYNQPAGYRPAINNPAQVNNYRPQQPLYGQGTFNQTRPASHQPQYPAYGQSSFNQTRPLPYQPQYPANGQNSFNQTRPAWQPQPHPPQFPTNPQYPAYGQQNTLNHTRPAFPQPSAPHGPVYPVLPNNPNNKPAIPSNSWTPSANQTLIYPQLPNKDIAPASPAVGSNGIPLAPLQPAPQGPHNWHSGGQAVLSYGPGHYPLPADNTNKNPPSHQGSSNPYANMFN